VRLDIKAAHFTADRLAERETACWVRGRAASFRTQ